MSPIGIRSRPTNILKRLHTISYQKESLIPWTLRFFLFILQMGRVLLKFRACLTCKNKWFYPIKSGWDSKSSKSPTWIQSSPHILLIKMWSSTSNQIWNQEFLSWSNITQTKSSNKSFLCILLKSENSMIKIKDYRRPHTHTQKKSLNLFYIVIV